MFCHLKAYVRGTSLAVQWLRLHLPVQGVRVRSLVRERRFPHASRPKNQNMKQKQYCNKFNKDFKKMVHIKKSWKKKEKKSICSEKWWSVCVCLFWDIFLIVAYISMRVAFSLKLSCAICRSMWPCPAHIAWWAMNHWSGPDWQAWWITPRRGEGGNAFYIMFLLKWTEKIRNQSMNRVVFSCPELALKLGLKIGDSRQERKGKGRKSFGNGIALR